MKKYRHRLSASLHQFGIVGVIAAKITCMVGMQLSLLLGLLGASGVALPFLDPVNRILGPISLPLFVVSLALLALGALRRGPVALALVMGGGLLLYAAMFAHGMSVLLYGLAMAMLLGPFLVGPMWCRIRGYLRGGSNACNAAGGTGE